MSEVRGRIDLSIIKEFLQSWSRVCLIIFSQHLETPTTTRTTKRGDANRNDIQADQEELVDPTVDASKVPIEDIRILVVPMDCSDVQDGMSPFPILPFDELQYKKVCFNMQSLTFTILIEPSLDKDKDKKAPLPRCKRKKSVKLPLMM
ncbi:hypothetical protein E5676_scaffold110G001970 [Cucumis melo var. makuwa]|uniref:Uncharacterized protein n=1 Tax=Cucumis melo var. makuwa TaxID=1194695 RepID=A0A5D3BBP1_CUCMM|nr:hypothetical protein E6C27_scaffold20G001290 [Cucumis melo var. makuwa]TYJ95895.1 hypothetical protein E5676_scaffold110G001970 [Cucumis melo var. makuwa]